MSIGFDYRQHLLRAAQEFLGGTEESVSHGRSIVHSCPPTRPYTVADMVWGSIISLLKDILFQRDVEYLESLVQFLSGASAQIMTGVISYDFVPLMDEREKTCYAVLRQLVGLLERYQDASSAQARATYKDEYARLHDEVRHALGALSIPEHLGDETLHHLVLREAGAVVTGMDIELSRLHQHLTLGFPSVAIYSRRSQTDLPDAAGAVLWAKRTLESLARRESTWVTWYIHAEGLRLSIH